MLYNTPCWCLELPKSQQRQGQENSQRYKLFRPAVARRPLVWYWPYICHARSLVNTVNLLLWICRILGWGNIFWGNYTSQHLLCPKAVPGPQICVKGHLNTDISIMFGSILCQRQVQPKGSDLWNLEHVIRWTQGDCSCFESMFSLGKVWSQVEKISTNYDWSESNTFVLYMLALIFVCS